jgi:hypothetical protein
MSEARRDPLAEVVEDWGECPDADDGEPEDWGIGEGVSDPASEPLMRSR